jgi:large repetitive protein
MRRFFTSGRRRYALVLFVAAGSIVLMGNQCAPTKPPAPTGLSIDPTSWDFGDITSAVPKTFTVTNNGPDTSGILNVVTNGGNATDFDIPVATDNCTGQVLDQGETCTLDVEFVGSGVLGERSTDLVVSSDKAADGKAVAALTGTLPP